MLRTVQVTRYVMPLREGGSLPALVEADDGFLYVLKFRGAGQGRAALIAELLGGELARALGLHVPELVFITLDEAFGRTEPDEEIQDLLRASTGLNLGLHYLSGAITFDPLVNPVEGRLASQIVWLDALITNVDRTARNTNMLVWHRELWLIDHGAAFYFHHSDQPVEEAALRSFGAIKDHVFLSAATDIESVAAEYREQLTADKIAAIVSLIPDDWLTDAGSTASPDEQRAMYAQFLTLRLAHADRFVEAIIAARHGGI